MSETDKDWFKVYRSRDDVAQPALIAVTATTSTQLFIAASTILAQTLIADTEKRT
jgi:hypothetical protein